MRVHNKYHKTAPPDARFIGRGSPHGNPYKIGEDGTREEVIQKYEKYARLRLIENPKWLDSLRGADLICYCAPKACHGDVLIRLCEEFR